MENKILQGNALTKMKELPEKSINMCMTSPPYWALRDYGDSTSDIIWSGDENCKHDWEIHKTPPRGGHSHPDRPPKVGANRDEMLKGTSARFGYESNYCNKCGAWKGQLGLEPTFDQYISNLCDIFDEVKRVLRDDGTCWVNLGDTYASGGGKATEQSFCRENEKTQDHPDNPSKSKLRGTMGKCLLSIPARFQIEMINRGWILRNTIIWHKPNCMPSSVKDRFTVDFEYLFFFSKKKKYYFETQYEPLANGTKERYKYSYKDLKGNFTGLQRGENITERTMLDDSKGRIKRTTWRICPQPFNDAHFAVYPEELCETPIKAGCPECGIVLDPFFGAGTTGLVALKQNKKFLGIELNPEYITIAEKRLKPFMEQTKLTTQKETNE